MKYFVYAFIVLLCLDQAIAQKTYVDPTKKIKKGLLEESEAKVEKVEVASSTSSVSSVSGMSLTPQEQLCECVKLMNMNSQLLDRHYYADKIESSAVDRDDLIGRRDNVENTMAYIVHQNKNAKPILNRKKCKGNEIGERDIGKLVSMIEKQEKKCDVYKIRGIDNDE